jgi:hypothetical protein
VRVSVGRRAARAVDRALCRARRGAEAHTRTVVEALCVRPWDAETDAPALMEGEGVAVAASVGVPEGEGAS